MMRPLTQKEYKALNRGSSHKYGAKFEIIDGIRFPSKAEAKRYGELKLLQAGDLVRDLRVHVEFPIMVNEQLICTYEADFVYEGYGLKVSGSWEWKRIVEDVKGMRTRDYMIKKKLMRAVHGITIMEIRR